MIENEDWKLGCFFDWRPKYKSVKCENCCGNGVVGGGFKDLDGERECSSCLGLGYTSVSPKSQPPEIPEDLREHMRRAWWDFVNKESKK